MPDNETVTEQQTDDVAVVENPDEKGFEDAFKDALGEKTPEKDAEGAAVEGEEKDKEKETPAAEKKEGEEEDPEKKVAQEKKDAKAAEKTDEKDKATQEKDKKDKEEEETEEKTEDQLAEERGKKLVEDKEIAAEKKKTDDAEAIAKAEKDKAAGEGAEDEVKPLTKERISNFKSLLGKDDVPDVIELDGHDYDIGEYLTDYPEAQIVSGIVTQKILERLVDNGVLITAEDHAAQIADIENRMFGVYFDLRVTQQIPDAIELAESDGFKEWLEKTATKEDKALLDSDNPGDYILGMKRFTRGAKPVDEAAEKRIAAAKEKKRLAKKDEDDIHGSTMNAHTSSEGFDKEASDFGSAFSEAQEKAEKK